MAHNLNIYSTDGRETSYGIYVNGTKQATVNLTWSITTTCTNGTYSGASVINRGSGTATVTLSANSGYALPSSITVTNASYTYNQSTGVVSLSEPTGDVTITCVCEQSVIYPVKGDLISIDMTGSGTPQQYRVLKINDSVAEVLAMSNASKQQFASSSSGTYQNNNLDTYLNTTWYNTLSATAKQAIIDKTFRQDTWYKNTSGNPDYEGKSSGNTAYQLSLGNASFGNQITRHAYAIGVQDVIDYLEVTPQMTQTNTTLTYSNVWTMFWNSTTSHSGSIWLRSAYAGNTNYAIYADGNYGNFKDGNATASFVVRPALTIDLSKIDFTIN